MGCIQHAGTSNHAAHCYTRFPLQVVFLYLHCNLLLSYPGLTECLHQSPPCVSSTLHHVVLTLEPPCEHFVQEQWGGFEGRHRPIVKSESQSERENLRICQSQQIVAHFVCIRVICKSCGRLKQHCFSAGEIQPTTFPYISPIMIPKYYLYY